MATASCCVVSPPKYMLPSARGETTVPLWPSRRYSICVALKRRRRERGFSRAAAKLGVSPSSLRQTVRSLGQSLGVRLLPRATRSVAPTEAGERLLQSVGPRLAEVAAELTAVGDLAVKLKGTVRITSTDCAVDTLIWPRLAKLLPE